jgi:hypothetical protein
MKQSVKQFVQWTAVIWMACGAAIAVAQMSAPVKDDLFAGTEVFAKGASDITEVTMNPDTLDLVTGRDGKKAHSMVLNVVRTYTYDKPGMYRAEDVDAYRNKLNSTDWYCSIHTRSLKTGDSTDVCNKRRSDDMVETAIITVSPKSLTFIHIIRKKGDGEHSEWSNSLLMSPLGGLSSLAMLDAGAMPNVDINVDLAVDAAMNQMRSMDWDAMQAKMKEKMKDLNRFNADELTKRMDDATKRLDRLQKHPASGDEAVPEGETPKP